MFYVMCSVSYVMCNDCFAEWRIPGLRTRYYQHVCRAWCAQNEASKLFPLGNIVPENLMLYLIRLNIEYNKKNM